MYVKPRQDQVLTICNLAFFTPRFLRARREGFLARMFAFEVLLYLISFVLLISQVLNTVGVGLPQTAGGFLVGLYLMGAEVRPQPNG